MQVSLLVLISACVTLQQQLDETSTATRFVAGAMRTHLMSDHEVSGSGLLVVVAQTRDMLSDIPLPSHRPKAIYVLGGSEQSMTAARGEKASSIALLLQDASVVERLLVDNITTWHSDVRLLVLLRTRDDVFARASARTALRAAWKVGITHTAVVVDRPATATVKVFGWHPILSWHCSHKAPSTQLLLRCPRKASAVQVNAILSTWQQHFPRSWNLATAGHDSVRYCSVPVVVCQVQPLVLLPHSDAASNATDITEIDGVEVRLVRAIAQAMHFEPRFYTPPSGGEWGVIFENGSGTGLMGELVSGRAEIGIGGIMPMSERARSLTMSRFYAYSYLSWAVPRPREQPPWRSLVAPFTMRTWLAFIVTFCVAAVGALLISKRHQLAGGAFLFPWGTILGASMSHLPCLTWQRIVLASWLLAFLVLSAAYQGALFSVLARPRALHAPNSLHELLDNNVPIGGHPGFLSLFDLEDRHVADIVRRSYVQMMHVLPVLDEVARGEREMALVANKNMLHWYNAIHRDDGQMVHVAREDITSYPMASLLRKNSPMVEQYDRLLISLCEAGFLVKWYSDLDKLPGLRPVHGPRPLTISQLSVSFLCLGAGLVLAFATLMLELLFHVLSSRHRATSCNIELMQR